VAVIFEDDSEVWLRDIMENHHEEAHARALSLLEGARTTETGCRIGFLPVIYSLIFIISSRSCTSSILSDVSATNPSLKASCSISQLITVDLRG